LNFLNKMVKNINIIVGEEGRQTTLKLDGKKFNIGHPTRYLYCLEKDGFINYFGITYSEVPKELESEFEKFSKHLLEGGGKSHWGDNNKHGRATYDLFLEDASEKYKVTIN